MTAEKLKCDVIVAGAGPAGLATACLLAQEGVNTICVGPVAGAGDTRTTALFGGAERLLNRLGASAALEGKRAPLRSMRIIDRLQDTDYPSSLRFPASEIGLDAFGSNYRNVELLAVLEDVAAKSPTLVRVHDMINSIHHHFDGVEATLADGRFIDARVVAACDGRRSPARAAAGIAATNFDYHQTAIAFQVRHQRPHDDVSIEVHRPGGPLTFIPLSSSIPGNFSAVNWLVSPDEVEGLLALDEAEFAAALHDASGGVLGQIEHVDRRAAFPITGLTVDCLAQNRTVLIGEAAHVLPPIGAQGLNLGFRDAAVFTELVTEALGAGKDPGAAALTARYCTMRAPDVMTRRTATDLLNRSLLFGGGALPHLRGLGLVLLGSSSAARRKLMTEGMGAEASQPRLMRA